MKTTIAECLYLVLFTFLLMPELNAQKLPNIQENSLEIPTSMKVDGKTIEWPNFQAYNKNADVFYSIANNEEKLYLSVQATDPLIIQKIILGGITFSINHSLKKNEKGRTIITFPRLERRDRQKIVSSFKKQSVIDNSSPASSTQADSLLKLTNVLFSQASKTILVQGVKELGDSIVSIYNTEGISASGMFNAPNVFTCELVFPIKHLSFISGNGNQFLYSLTLNGTGGDLSNISASEVKKISIGGAGNAGNGVTVEGRNPMVSANIALLNSPTFFRGEYKLFK